MGVPAVDKELLFGLGTSLHQIVQVIVGLPLFVYGAALVQHTIEINHTAQNRETKKTKNS